MAESPAQEPPKTFRPLRTGKSFVLVVPSRRVVVRRWDKVAYQPGEECRMSILGQGLGKEPLSITVEAEDEDGNWTAVARTQAEVAEGEDQAVVSWRLPEEPVVPGEASVREADGSVLSNARFEDQRDLESGSAVWMLAQAAGFEGSSVQVVLEREGDPGQWLSVGEAVATVRSGALRTAVTLNASKEPQVPAPVHRIDSRGGDRVDPAAAAAREVDGALLSARFEDPSDLQEGGTVWMVARAAGLDGRCVQVLLEREDPSGDWVSVGQASATVRSSAVRAAVTPDADKTRTPQG